MTASPTGRPFIFAPGEETYHSIGQYLCKAYAMGPDVGKR